MFFKNNIDKYFQRFQAFYLHSLTIYLINTYIYSHIYWSSSRCDKITSHGEYKTIKIYIIYTIVGQGLEKLKPKKYPYILRCILYTLMHTTNVSCFFYKRRIKVKMIISVGRYFCLVYIRPVQFEFRSQNVKPSMQKIQCRDFTENIDWLICV